MAYREAQAKSNLSTHKHTPHRHAERVTVNCIEKNLALQRERGRGFPKKKNYISPALRH